MPFAVLSNARTKKPPAELMLQLVACLELLAAFVLTVLSSLCLPLKIDASASLEKRWQEFVISKTARMRQTAA